MKGPVTMPINELMNQPSPGASVAGKGGQSVASAPPTIETPSYAKRYQESQISQSPNLAGYASDFMAREDNKAALESQSNALQGNAGNPTFNPNPMGGKGGQPDPSLADPTWRPLPPTIPQQPPTETPTFNPNPMGGKGGQQQRPTFNPYPMGGKGGYGGMQGGKGGYGQVSINPYVQGGKGGYGQPSVNQSPMGGKGGYGRPSPYSQPMGGKGGGSMPQPSASSSGGKGGQQTGGNPYAMASPSASSGGKGGSTGGKGG